MPVPMIPTVLGLLAASDLPKIQHATEEAGSSFADGPYTLEELERSSRGRTGDCVSDSRPRPPSP